jgi:Ca2+-binding RTX toxin-like protein
VDTLGIVYGSIIENARGGSAGDRLEGNAVANELYGNGGQDALYGGANNDFLEGGSGADALYGGSGIDTVDYNGPAGVTVRIGGVGSGGDAQGDFVGADVENIQGTGTFGDSLTGSSATNRLSGYGGNDALYGLAGNDTLYGGADNDFMEGGAGADNLYGGSGIDTVDYNGPAGVNVKIGGFGVGGDAQGDFIGTDVENLQGTGTFGDSLTGSNAANRLSGYGGNDRLTGLGGTDVLDGGSGNDRLVGGTGNDSVIGGAGADVFAFLGSFGNDRVLDFADGADRFDLDAGLTFANLKISILDLDSDGLRDDLRIGVGNSSFDLLDTNRNVISSADFLF